MATEARAPARALRAAALVLLALAALCALSAPAAAAPRIGVATMQPGEIFFERSGHIAIIVDDPASGPPLYYNFGFFDPDEPGFHLRFVQEPIH